MNNEINNFQLMAKPTGSVCNIDCEYYFYLEKHHLYPDRKSHWKMDEETLENYIKHQISSQNAPVVDFPWQGGEPTLMGLDFFKKAIIFQKKYCKNKQINNYFQTNAIRINDDWARFLKEHNFLVGVSLDGDANLHNTYRKTRSGQDTYHQVINGLEYLKKHHVDFNTLSVISSANVNSPLAVYNALKKAGSTHIQFLPLVERQAKKPDQNGLTLISPEFDGECQVAPWTVDPVQYGIFLNTIFEYWLEHDFGKIFIMNFEEIISQIAGITTTCIISDHCGKNLIIEANGDIYSCDHFVYPEHRLGNINKDDLKQMVNSPQNYHFGEKKALNQDCQRCDVKAYCNGGCPKHRFVQSSTGKPDHNYLCPAYKSHLHYALNTMKEIVRTLREGMTLEQAHRAIMKKFKEEQEKAVAVSHI